MLADDGDAGEVVVEVGQEGAEDHENARHLSQCPEEAEVAHDQQQPCEVGERALDLPYLAERVPFLAKNLKRPAKPMKK